MQSHGDQWPSGGFPARLTPLEITKAQGGAHLLHRRTRKPVGAPISRRNLFASRASLVAARFASHKMKTAKRTAAKLAKISAIFYLELSKGVFLGTDEAHMHVLVPVYFRLGGICWGDSYTNTGPLSSNFKARLGGSRAGPTPFHNVDCANGR